ncbi:type VI secretion system Vgr family protein [Acetobacter sp. DsW_063]|uniref:type VI secretion system Vgr family protein n=1 Tax=Acetobacter sp. DsW_063 TaxID=1514894 RepID=UPI00130232A6|nr:type VI secretion system tip protein TssI/VgrG [Acetobacter sp. DsW_063]
MGGAFPSLLLMKSPMGDDTQPFEEGTLHAVGLRAHERLSAPYVMSIEAVCTERGLDADAFLGQPVSITVRRKNGIDRFFHGVVRQFVALGIEQRGRWHYRIEAVPSLWFLSQSVDCRIFQKKTAVQILRQVFSDHGVTKVKFQVTGAQTPREYTTQFNEDDLTFCHRIMQESGLFYYFEHTKDQHTLIVTDSNQGFQKMEQPDHRVIELGDNVDIFNDWRTSAATGFGVVKTQDYDPTQPTTPVSGRGVAQLAGPDSSKRDVYRWPSMTTEHSIAGDRARFATEASDVRSTLCGGRGYDPNLCPGFRFMLLGDPTDGGADNEYVVEEVFHSAQDDTWVGGTAPADYVAQFSAFLVKTPWREPLVCHRPVMTGIYSAIVLGDGGEEIHADRLGRIKVRPLFDHRKETVASMAIWARVLHPWSGNKWGWQHLPRVGTEVGISFMSGDCDNPVVMGCFYHEQNPPVFDIPSEKTKMGFRSRSTHGGGTQDYNELSFDDRLGQEVFFMHAQKDHLMEVERNQSDSIGGERDTVVHDDDSLTSRTGNISATAEMGSILMQAETSIKLQCGESIITMTPAGITVEAPEITINGTATVTISGGMVLIQP